MDVDRDLRGVAIDPFLLDLILPAQPFNPRKKLAPEHRLRMAVLDDAIRCVKQYRLPTDGQGRRLFHEAKQWLLAAEPHWPYSFEHICEVLDLDANAVRHHLRLAPERPAVSVSREMQTTTPEGGTHRPNDIGQPLWVRLPYPIAHSSETLQSNRNPTLSDMGISHVAMQTK